MNLARVLGPAAAERFSALHRALSGRDDDHPYWDVAALLGGLRAHELASWTDRDREFLRQALRRL